MPELPEVEVSRLGISPHLLGRVLSRVDVRQRQLRWPIPEEILAITNQPILSVTRRAKYLLIEIQSGSMIVHLGMSGHLKIVPSHLEAGKHDHVDWVFDNDTVLRLNDTRRFGAVLWQAKGTVHPLLSALGPEPLQPEFTAEHLFQQCQKRQSPIKTVLMDNHVVVGVGNIYANESLFKASISPTRPANTLTLAQCTVLREVVRQTLAEAIVQGGTTLKDFSQVDGKPGYFRQELQVYGRGGEPCPLCAMALTEIRLGQRSTVYCQFCQA